MIYVIGDSHVSIWSGEDTKKDGSIHIQPEYDYCYTIKEGEIFTLRSRNEFINKISNVMAIKMGSHTAYNLINKIDKLYKIINDYNINYNDIILLCFGEIDIRAHIGFKECINSAIVECVDRYVNVLNKLKGDNFNVGVVAPYASLPNELTYSIGKNYGDSKSRNLITTKFNEYLNSKMIEYGMLFIDFHKLMLNDDYTSNKIYFKDNIHASVEVIPFIIDELNRIK